jgi:hypothetical protein
VNNICGGGSDGDVYCVEDEVSKQDFIFYFKRQGYWKTHRKFN